MKFIVCLLLVLVSATECNEKSEASQSITAEKPEMRLAQNDIKEIFYRASTRGYFQVIKISGDSISFTNDYNLEKFKTYAIPTKEKEALLGLLSGIDVKELPNIQPPSKTHQYDAAPAAYLQVTTADEVYMTPTFDHGAPPKTITSIVEKMLSIKSLFEKP